MKQILLSCDRVRNHSGIAALEHSVVATKMANRSIPNNEESFERYAQKCTKQRTDHTAVYKLISEQLKELQDELLV